MMVDSLSLNFRNDLLFRVICLLYSMIADEDLLLTNGIVVTLRKLNMEAISLSLKWMKSRPAKRCGLYCFIQSNLFALWDDASSRLSETGMVLYSESMIASN